MRKTTSYFNPRDGLQIEDWMWGFLNMKRACQQFNQNKSLQAFWNGGTNHSGQTAASLSRVQNPARCHLHKTILSHLPPHQVNLNDNVNWHDMICRQTDKWERNVNKCSRYTGCDLKEVPSHCKFKASPQHQPVMDGYAKALGKSFLVIPQTFSLPFVATADTIINWYSYCGHHY